MPFFEIDAAAPVSGEMYPSLISLAVTPGSAAGVVAPTTDARPTVAKAATTPATTTPRPLREALVRIPEPPLMLWLTVTRYRRWLDGRTTRGPPRSRCDRSGPRSTRSGGTWPSPAW